MKYSSILGLFVFAIASLAFTGANKTLPSVELVKQDGTIDVVWYDKPY